MSYTVTTANTTFSSTNSLVITKPTGLAVNDLILAVVTDDGSTITPPSGFALYASNTSVFVYYKVADANDVAATNFTFGFSTTITRMGGMMRIYGHQFTSPLSAYTTSTADNTFSPTLGSTITPTYTDSLLIIFAHAYSGTTTTMSSFSNVTTPPTYTIGWNVVDGASQLSAMGYGMRNAATATGNFTGSGGNGSSDWRGICVCVNPYTITIADTATITDSKLVDITSLETDIVTTTESYLYSIGRIWRRAAKPITTWIFGSKN